MSIDDIPLFSLYMHAMNSKMNSIQELNRRSFLHLNAGLATGLALSSMSTNAQTLKGTSN
jgi:hypothetical protein